MKKYVVSKEHLINRGDGFETKTFSEEIERYDNLRDALKHLIEDCNNVLTYLELNNIEENKITVLAISEVEDKEYTLLDLYGTL